VKPPPILAPKPKKAPSAVAPPVVAPKPTKSEILQKTRELPWIVFPPAMGDRAEEGVTEGVGQGPAEDGSQQEAPVPVKKSPNKPPSPFVAGIAAEVKASALKRQQSDNLDVAASPSPPSAAASAAAATPPVVLPKPTRTSVDSGSREAIGSRPSLSSGTSREDATAAKEGASAAAVGDDPSPAPLSSRTSFDIAPPAVTPRKPSGAAAVAAMAPRAIAESSGEEPTVARVFDDLQPALLISPSPKKGLVKQKGKRLPRKPMRVYTEEEAYKSIALATTATTKEIVSEMAEKSHVDDETKYCLSEVDSETWAERILAEEELVLAVVLGWDVAKRTEMRLYFKRRETGPFHATKKQSKDEAKARKAQEAKFKKRTAYRGLIQLESGEEVEVDLTHQSSSAEIIEEVVKKAKLNASDNWKMMEKKSDATEAIEPEVRNLLIPVLLCCFSFD